MVDIRETRKYTFSDSKIVQSINWKMFVRVCGIDWSQKQNEHARKLNRLMPSCPVPFAEWLINVAFIIFFSFPLRQIACTVLIAVVCAQSDYGAVTTRLLNVIDCFQLHSKYIFKKKTLNNDKQENIFVGFRMRTLAMALINTPTKHRTVSVSMKMALVVRYRKEQLNGTIHPVSQ